MLLDLGIDAAIDYKQGDIGGQIGATCPKGVDVFFDNVGGEILDQVLLLMAKGGRIVVCGAMAHFAASPPTIGHHIMLASRGATMGGFYYFDYLLRWPQARGRLKQFLLDGRIRELFDIECGFEKVPAAAISQFTGTAGGRKIIKISD